MYCWGNQKSNYISLGSDGWKFYIYVMPKKIEIKKSPQKYIFGLNFKNYILSKLNSSIINGFLSFIGC